LKFYFDDISKRHAGSRTEVFYSKKYIWAGKSRSTFCESLVRCS
jgi:hypothetical protein